MSENELKNYTKLEIQRHNEITKLRLTLKKKQDKLQKQIDEIEEHQNILYHKLRQLDNKVDDRVVRKCKHLDVRGPYSCSRDDCSGGHHQCRDCGNQVSDATNEQFKKTGKKWIAWNEK